MAGVDWGKQMGPLPLGGWVATIGGGLMIAIYSRRNNATDTVTTGRSTVKDEGVGNGFDGYIPAINVTPTTPQVSDPVTNEEWARKAINLLIAQGYDAAQVDTAIRKYLESTKLSLQESALVREALVKLGAPPVPLPIPPEVPTIPKPTPVVVAPKPTPVIPKPVPPPAPKAIRIIVVTPWNSSRSTLWGMAREFYGDGNQWRRIYEANKKGVRRPDGSPGFISNPNYLRPGDRVYVP